MAQEGQVVLCMALANAAVVLAKGDIQHPVDRVFNPPVCACSGQKQFGVGREAGDEVASFKRGVVLHLPKSYGNIALIGHNSQETT